MSQRKPWIAHTRHEMPVPSYAVVMARYRDGSVVGPDQAHTWEWAHTGEGDDIVAYYRVDGVAPDGTPRSPDRGPWSVKEWIGGRIVLQSDDFEHDVALEISGDFAGPAQKAEYAQSLAAWMNHHLSADARQASARQQAPEAGHAAGD